MINLFPQFHLRKRQKWIKLNFKKVVKRERSLSEENTEVESESHKEREKGKGKRKEKMKEREEKEDDSSYYDYGEHGENNEGYLSEEENLKKLRFKYKGY